jgi:hypothetical protein
MTQKTLAQQALEKLEQIQKDLKIKLAADPGAGDPPAPTEETLTAKDGTIYKISGAMEAGSEIMVVGTEGETPAPDGIVELEDGTMITVASGKIEKIEKSPAGADPLMDTAQLKAMMAAIDPTGSSTDPVTTMLRALMESVFGWEIRSQEQEQVRESAIAAYKANMASLESKNSALVAELQALKDLRKTENQTIMDAFDAQMSAINALAESPAGGPGANGGSQSMRVIPKRSNSGGPLSRLGSKN